MWIIAYKDDLTYDDLYDCDCNNHGGGHIYAVGRTKKECEDDFKYRASHQYGFGWQKTMYAVNRRCKIMYSPPHNRQLLIYEV